MSMKTMAEVSITASSNVEEVGDWRTGCFTRPKLLSLIELSGQSFVLVVLGQRGASDGCPEDVGMVKR